MMALYLLGCGREVLGRRHGSRPTCTKPILDVQKCDQPGDILRVPFFCTEHNAERRGHLPDLAQRPSTTAKSIAVLFSTGSKKHRINQRGRLLEFVGETGPAGRW